MIGLRIDNETPKKKSTICKKKMLGIRKGYIINVVVVWGTLSGCYETIRNVFINNNFYICP